MINGALTKSHTYIKSNFITLNNWSFRNFSQSMGCWFSKSPGVGTQVLGQEGSYLHLGKNPHMS